MTSASFPDLLIGFGESDTVEFKEFILEDSPEHTRCCEVALQSLARRRRSVVRRVQVIERTGAIDPR